MTGGFCIIVEGNRVGSDWSAAESVYRGTQAGSFMKEKGRDVDTHGERVRTSTACTTGRGGWGEREKKWGG